LERRGYYDIDLYYFYDDGAIYKKYTWYNMKKQEPAKRIKNFDEVNLGYSEKEAIKEASRCLQCKIPQCVQGCPINIDIPGFIKMIKESRPEKAIEIIKKSNNLPGICGRVCPQEDQCELKCILGKKSIKIGYLERFAADNKTNIKIEKKKKINKKIAAIGSGPASLTCAADLALKGYDVTIFEALHEFGGVLRYGIPEFRLPKYIVDKEIDYIKRLGVKIEKNIVIGKTLSLEDLKKKFDAIFIGVGAGLPNFMGIDGETLPGVYSANEFLTRINLMKAHDKNSETPIKKAKDVIVVGGGNVAIDAARSAKRLGSNVNIIYRRSLEEMPARDEEIENAKEEGIHFILLTNPIKIIGTEKVEGIECIQMKLGEPSLDERRQPIPIENSEFVLDCDQVIIAIGQNPNPLLVKQTKLYKDIKSHLRVDENMQTSDPQIFAGGDIVKGNNGTVIRAMSNGKIAANAIDKMLTQ
jgi:glutamate synthase (NADPH) small chain